MNRNVRVMSAAAVVALSALAVAQTTVPWNRIPSAVGTVLEYKANEPLSSVPVQVGSQGGPQTWNLDTSFTGYTHQVFIVDKAGTPFGAEFPDANHVTRGDDGEPVVAYTYSRLNQQAFDLLGIGMTAPGGDIVLHYDSAYRALSLPLEMGTSWQRASSYRVDYDSGTFSIFIERGRVRVDAWGTAVLPFGSHACLRVNAMDTLITLHTVRGVPEPPDTFFYRQYTWWAPDLGQIATATGPDGDTSLVFTESDNHQVMIAAPTGAVAEQPQRRVSTFRVASPFVGRTTVPGREQETFELYDVSGKLVVRQPGSAIGAGMPSGAYTIRSGAGSTARIVKLD